MKNDANTNKKRSLLELVNQERFRFAIFSVALLMLAILLILSRGIWLRKDKVSKAEEYSDSKIVLDYDFGYDNLIKRGRFLPINVTYQNRENRAFEGTISFRLSKESTNEIEAKYPIQIAGNEEKKETYYIFLEFDSKLLEVCLLDQDGGIVFKREEEFESGQSDSSLIIGVLSDDKSKLDYFDNVSIDYGMLTTRLIDLTPYDFPSFERGLDQMDVVLISNYRIRDLDIVQSRALMNWVDSGGILIMGTGRRVDDTLGRYAPELLEDMYKDPSELEVSLGTYKEEGNVINELIKIPIVDFKLHGGNIVHSNGDVNLVSAVNRDKGLIAVAAYDFSDLSAYARIHNSFVDDLLVGILGSTKVYELAYDDGVLQDNYYRGDVDKLLEEGDFHRLPPIKWLILVLSVYIVVVSPLLFFLLKRFGFNQLYAYSIIVMSLLFSYMIYALGNDTRINDISYSYASIFDYDEDNIVERSFLSLRNPYNEPYHFSLPKNYSILPFSNAGGSFGTNEQSDISIDYKTDKTDVSIGYIGGFNSVTMDLRQNIDNVKGEGFFGELKFYNNAFTGEITSNFDFAVEDVTVLMYGKMLTFGDFLPRETKSVKDALVSNIPLTETKLLSSTITGIHGFSKENMQSEEYYIARKRNELLNYYIENYVTGYTVDAKIIGFADKQLQENMIEPSDLDSFGVSLLTASLAVDNREDDRIYRSALMKAPAIISGEYYKEYNMTFSIEPTVLSYDLGEDISVEEVHIQHISKSLDFMNAVSSFSGDISILNVYNDNFDLLEEGKTVLSAEDLLDYISYDNHITIRYSHRLETPNERAVLLPMIFVLGTEY